MVLPLTARSRRALARAAAVALVLGSGLVGTAATASSAAAAPADCTGGGSVAVVAHPDDDLFFMSPDVSADVVAGVCTTTVYVTSGDAGSSDGYVTARERGVEAAYATTAAVADRWTVTTTTVAGHAVELHVLDARPTVRLVFMGLPDGFPDGSGSERSGWTSLQKLYLGGIPSITTLDGSSTYTRAELVRTLGAIITASGADRVRTLDYEGAFGDGDHGDHHAVARLVVEARAAAAPRTGLSGYLGYSSAAKPANVSGAALEAKWSALLVYARYDPLMCSTRAACDARPEGTWMPRSYVLAGAVPAPTSTTTPTTAPTTTAPTAAPTTAPTTTAPTTTAPTAAPTTAPTTTAPTTTAPTAAPTTAPTTTAPTTTAPVSVEVAGTGVVTASSQNAADSQTAAKAVDGVVSGYPGDWTAEWATAGGRSGSWWQEVYPKAVTVDRVVLFDRPNADDRATGATLTFSDGTSVAVGALNDDGSATTVSFPARSTTGVRVAITSVSATTRNVGLSEVQLWTAAGTVATPTATPTTAPTTTTPTTTPTTAPPTTTAPTTTAPTTTAPVSVEVAGTGVVTASSQNAADSQTAAKAVDGVISGYPGDWTAEWATAGGRAGSWWQEVYPKAVTVDRVVLFDRPNASDRVTAATLTFSDGTSVKVGALKDDGSATTFSFAARSTTSLRITLTTVSSTTRNAGLSEVQLWTTAR